MRYFISTQKSCCSVAAILLAIILPLSFWPPVFARVKHQRSSGMYDYHAPEAVSAIVQLALAESSTCALTENGAVKCWGYNKWGQLGDGTFVTNTAPEEVIGLHRGVIAIVAGLWHFCALIDGGTVKCWGANHYGQLGDGTRQEKYVPVDVVGLESTVSAITAGMDHTCALIEDGRVKCWGDNYRGQLGDGTTGDENDMRMTPVDVIGLSDDVKAIHAGGWSTCALTQSGAVKCWGARLINSGTTVPLDIEGLDKGVTSIVMGENHTCALTEGGAVKCWGNNLEGQLGDGQGGSPYSKVSEIPVNVDGMSRGVTTIAAGSNHTCALTEGGAVKCWGLNHYGQLGDSTLDMRNVPVGVVSMNRGVSYLEAGSNFNCALIDDGKVKCWGDNTFGQLGNISHYVFGRPTDVVGLSKNTVAIFAGSYHNCALTSEDAVKCWGINYFGQLGDGTTENKQAPTDVAVSHSGVTAMAGSSWHTCAVVDRGAVKCWGLNNYGQLGDGATAYSYTVPVDVVGLDSGVAAVSTASHTCALTEHGGVKCWGWNRYGQLGDGTNGDQYNNRVTPVDVAGLDSDVTDIATGSFHTCALKRDSEVLCWGYNGQGQLGDGTIDQSLLPVAVKGLDSGIQAIVAGNSHTCALSDAGDIFCWGYNGVGQLGDGTRNDSVNPVPVKELEASVKAIIAGAHHTCALTVGGGVKCWGYNLDHQLGDGTPYRTDPLPVDIAGLERGVASIVAANGGFHTCALTEDSSVKCWGSNSVGQLGNNLAWHATPVACKNCSSLEGQIELFLPLMSR